MSESQAELRAINQTLRLYQVNSQTQTQSIANRPAKAAPSQILSSPTRPSKIAQMHSAPVNVTHLNSHASRRSVLPFSERLARPLSENLEIEGPLPENSQLEQLRPENSRPEKPQSKSPLDLPPIPAPSQSFTRRGAAPSEDDIDWEPVRPVTQSDVIDRLQQKSVQYLQQFVQPTPDTPNAQIDAALQRLEAQAQQINQLAATQEAALLELKVIAQQIEQDWKTLEVVNAARAGYDASTVEIPAVCEYRSISVPQVEKNQAGVLVLTARSVDLFKAEREAALTAQSLRFRTAPTFKPRSSWTRKFSQLLLGQRNVNKAAYPASRPMPAEPQRSPDDHPHHRMRRRKARSLNFREGVSLMFGAVVVRVLLNLLLSAHPGLWFPAIALMVTPGAIAVYRSRVTPKSTLAWGYRLTFIMLGFWIGGRL
ncbi:MAG: hypothetical protein HY785_27685 [Oscillatoriophycideae cyanobacterium NC_groundwater_1537_Pr4_S-0.65um_50_18]|nr:hypothetical protein [Oscillatoriophycideae cyanobacterium NC_groundwater_1537_Pr4_S-0.65um_50_18]